MRENHTGAGREARVNAGGANFVAKYAKECVSSLPVSFWSLGGNMVTKKRNKTGLEIFVFVRNLPLPFWSFVAGLSQRKASKVTKTRRTDSRASKAAPAFSIFLKICPSFFGPFAWF